MSIVRSTLWAALFILADKWKTFLVVLVIAVCVAGLALTVSFVTSSYRMYNAQLDERGRRSCFVTPEVSPFAQPTGSQHALDLQDLIALQSQFAGKAAFYAISGTSREVAVGGRHVKSFILGMGPSELQRRGSAVPQLMSGRYIDSDDMTSLSRVCILNVPISTALFGGTSPLGKDVRVGNMPFKVVGVVENREIMGWRSSNFIAWVPLTTCLHRLLNVTALNALSFDVTPGYDVDRVAAEVAQVLRKRHGIAPPEKDDFSIVTPGQFKEAFNDDMRTVKRVGALIVVLAFLLAAGVLMQVQWVSVNHRTKEIGVRRALGASRRDVLRGFLLESLMISALGTILGLLLTLSAIPIISHANYEAPSSYTYGSLYSPLTHLQVDAWVLATCAISVLFIGLAAGVLPALRAVRVDPVEALT
jgi:putative ABC transport system permease protein